jgi:hypothetical protein
VGPNEAGKTNVLESILRLDRTGIFMENDGCIHLENPQPEVGAKLHISKSEIDENFDYIQEDHLREGEPVQIRTRSNMGVEPKIMGLDGDDLRELYRGSRSARAPEISKLENLQDYLEDMIEKSPDEVWNKMGVNKQFLSEFVISMKESNRRGTYSLNELRKDLKKLRSNLKRINFAKTDYNLSREEYDEMTDIVDKVESTTERVSENLENRSDFPPRILQELYNIVYIKEVREIEDEIKIDSLQKGEDSVYRDIFELSDLKISGFYSMGSRERKKKKGEDCRRN